jgi:hypothetical protein
MKMKAHGTHGRKTAQDALQATNALPDDIQGADHALAPPGAAAGQVDPATGELFDAEASAALDAELAREET